jgi:hypothetical protein
LLPVMRDPGSIPREVQYLCETGILLLALSCYIGDPNVIDHCGLIWGGLLPKPSHIHTQFHWSSDPPICLLSWGTRVQSPGGYSTYVKPGFSC